MNFGPFEAAGLCPFEAADLDPFQALMKEDAGPLFHLHHHHHHHGN
jgi:hypothetical protein